MLTIIVYLLIVLFIGYFYLKQRYFTTDSTLPGIPPQFLFGNLLQTGIIGYGQSMPSVFRELQSKFGDVFQFWLGPTRLVVVSRLEDVQHIFTHRHEYEQAEIFASKMKNIIPNAIICLTGTKFKRHATVAYPLFRRARVINHLPTIFDSTDKLIKQWRMKNFDPNFIHQDINEQMHRLIVDIFGQIFFDYDLHALDNEKNSSKSELACAFQTIISTVMNIIQAPTIIARLYLFLNIKYRRARDLVDRSLRQIIEQEIQEKSETRTERKRISLIASLIAALQDDEDVEATKDEEDKKGLSRAEVLDEMLTFIVAGSGSTAAALTWFIYLMSVHPEIQTKVKDELSSYNAKISTVEQLDSLVYLDCVIREMFRFVPPAVGTMRTLMIDDQLPSTGAKLKKGDLIFIPIHNLGRDPRYWSDRTDPDRFDPERFRQQIDESHHSRAASIPFGGGHRLCIGQDLARVVIKAVCAQFMQHVTFQDGGPLVNSGEYAGDGGDSIIPKKIGVTIAFDSESN